MEIVATFKNSSLRFGFNHSDITLYVTIGGAYYVEGYSDVQLYDELEFIATFDVNFVDESFYGSVNSLQLIYDPD